MPIRLPEQLPRLIELALLQLSLPFLQQIPSSNIRRPFLHHRAIRILERKTFLILFQNNRVPLRHSSSNLSQRTWTPNKKPRSNLRAVLNFRAAECRPHPHVVIRSEERRVGKEGTPRVSLY